MSSPHVVVDGRAGQQSRLADDFDHARGRGDKWLPEVQEVDLDLVALAGEQLTSALFLKSLKRRDVGAEDKLVDGLDVILVKLLGLVILVGPVGGAGLCVDHVDLLVVLNESGDGIRGKLVGDFVAQDHVDVDNVSLDVY